MYPIALTLVLLFRSPNSGTRGLMPIKRRYRIIGGILILTIAVIAALFQYSTQSKLVLAEALQFRRMLVTTQDDGAYRFFFRH